MKASEWQTIDSAPKDGSKFLAFEKGIFFSCWWYKSPCWEQYWMDNGDTEPEPTHWMPLPDAPK